MRSVSPALQPWWTSLLDDRPDCARRRAFSEETQSRRSIPGQIAFAPPRAAAEKSSPQRTGGTRPVSKRSSLADLLCPMEARMAGIRLEHGIWVLVADGEKALFLRNEGDAKYPNLEVVRELKDENPPTREQGTDKPGRYFDTGVPNKSSFEETDWHRIEKERFADEVADQLYHLAHKG